MPGPSWNKHHRAAWERLAVEAGDRMDLTTRVLMVASARLTRNGHAAFRRGELGRILAAVDPDTGEAVLIHRNTLRKAILRGIEAGMFAVGSSSECIRIPHYLTTHDAGRSTPCPVCERRKSAPSQGAVAPPQHH